MRIKVWRGIALLLIVLLVISGLPFAWLNTTTAQAKMNSVDRFQAGTSTATPVTDAKGQFLYRDNQALTMAMADGSAPTPIPLGTGFAALCAAWSHDGRQLAFIGGSTDFGLYVVSVSGGAPRAVFKTTVNKDPKATPIEPIDLPIGLPTWSPDGRTLAYTGQSGTLYLINVSDGKKKVSLNTLKFLSADWSPDSKQFVAFGLDKDNKPGVFTLKVDGSSLQSLVSLSDADLTFALSNDHFFARDTVLPRWSPDGKQITFASITSSASGNSANGTSVSSVYTIPAKGGSDPQRISDPTISAYAPSWSPDGKYLAYTTESGDQRAITVIDLSQPRFGPVASLSTGGCPVWKPGKL